MEMENENPLSNPNDVNIYAKHISNLLGGAEIKTTKRRRKKDDVHRDRFIMMINTYEYVVAREATLNTGLLLNFASYSDQFFTVIETLLLEHYGEEGYNIIDDYIYNRMDENGVLIPFGNDDIGIYYLKSSEDLWNFLNLYGLIKTK